MWWFFCSKESEPGRPTSLSGESILFSPLNRERIKQEFSGDLRLRLEMVRAAWPGEGPEWPAPLPPGPEGSADSILDGWPELAEADFGAMTWRRAPGGGRSADAPMLLRLYWPRNAAHNETGRATVAYWYFGRGFSGFLDFSNDTAGRIVESIRDSFEDLENASAALTDARADETTDRNVLLANIWMFASDLRQFGATPLHRDDACEIAKERLSPSEAATVSQRLDAPIVAPAWFEGRFALFHLNAPAFSEATDVEHYDIPKSESADGPPAPVVVGVRRPPQQRFGAEASPGQELLWRGQPLLDLGQSRFEPSYWRERAESRVLATLEPFGASVLGAEVGADAETKEAALESLQKRRDALAMVRLYPPETPSLRQEHAAVALRFMEQLKESFTDYQPPSAALDHAARLSADDAFRFDRSSEPAADTGDIEIRMKPVLALEPYTLFEITDRRGGFTRRTPILYAHEMTVDTVLERIEAAGERPAQRWPGARIQSGLRDSMSMVEVVQQLRDPRIVPLVDRRAPLELLCMLFPPKFAQRDDFSLADSLKNYAHFYGSYAADAQGYFQIIEGVEDFTMLNRQRNGVELASGAAQPLRYLGSGLHGAPETWSLGGAILFNRDAYRALARIWPSGYARIEAYQQVREQLDIAPHALRPETDAFLRRPLAWAELMEAMREMGRAMQ